jgi:hypothetical protein
MGSEAMTMRTATPVGPRIQPTARATPGRRITLVVVTAALVGAIVGGAAVALVANERLDDRAAELQAVQTDLDVSEAAVDDLQVRLATGQGAEARLQRQLDRARNDLATWVGPPFPDGRHFVFIEAMGVDQTPPRLVVDEATWFTDAEADRAARADGNLPAGQAHVENGYYIRNETPAWRTVELSPSAPVSIVLYPWGDIDQPAVVDLERFERMLGRDPWLLQLPYWLEVRDGVVTAIEQQFIP